MYKDIVQQYIDEIDSDYQLAKRIGDKVGHDDLEAINMINNATIISMCIKYEAFTSDLMSFLLKRNVQYNHPWSYTRAIARMLQKDISDIYESAHDVWEYYNTLKHINHKSGILELKITKEHNLKTSYDALDFAHTKLNAILHRLEQ